MPKQFKYLSAALASIIGGALLLGVVTTSPKWATSDIYANQQARAEVSRQNLQTAQDLSTAFKQVAEALRPSVVSISSVQKARGISGGGGGLPPGLFEGLPPELREQFRGFGDSQRQMPQQQGMGSGVIVRPDGYILTNNHVVQDADEITVMLSDGRAVEAEIVGTDPPTDLAVLKIDASGLTAAPLGDSDSIGVGDWVLAVGSPFGLEQTVTAGIISAKNRARGIVQGGDGYEDFLQTDAAINPGNSGGPLVNLHGEVVGINTAILSRSGGYNGIGFAIPSSMAEPILNSIIESGTVRRGLLGAQVGNITPDRAEELGLDTLRGAFVAAVVSDKPADKAGLQPGDVVVAMNGQPVRSGTQFRNMIAGTLPGTKVRLTVLRDGSEMQVDVVLDELKPDDLVASSPALDTELGMTVEPLDAETARELELDTADSGLVVTEIDPRGIAAQAELEVGDVLLRINRRPVGSPEEFARTFKELRENGQTIQLIVRSGDIRKLVTIR